MTVENQALVTASDIGPAPVRYVLLILADHSDPAGFCFPGIPLLCGETQQSRSTVIRALRALEEDGLIRKVNRTRENGSSTSNLYRLNLDLIRSRRRPSRSAEVSELAAQWSLLTDTPPDVSAAHDRGVTETPHPDQAVSAPVDNSDGGGVTQTPPPCLTDTPGGVTPTPLEPSLEPPAESVVVESETQLTTRAHAERSTTPADVLAAAPTSTDPARACSMCRLDGDGHTWVRIHPDRRPVTPTTICDHTSPLAEVLDEIEFTEQYDARTAGLRPAAPIPAVPNRRRRPEFTRGTPADRERARQELARARGRTT